MKIKEGAVRGMRKVKGGGIDQRGGLSGELRGRGEENRRGLEDREG